MIAHRIEWFTLHEITIARAEPKLAPARVTSTTRAEERARGWGGGSRIGPDMEGMYEGSRPYVVFTIQAAPNGAIGPL